MKMITLFSPFPTNKKELKEKIRIDMGEKTVTNAAIFI